MNKIKIPYIKDKHYELRQNLYRNVEPYIVLIGASMPLDIEKSYEKTLLIPSKIDPQELIGISAGISHGRIGNNMKRLGNLLKLQHGTPFESVQLNLHVCNISKSCGAQMSRYRAGQGHVSKSNRYTDNIFNVYNIYNSKDEEEVTRILRNDSREFQANIRYYDILRELDLKKEDARRCIPVSFATSRHWFINIRALRYFLKERLDSHAEWEIQRIACLLFFTCYTFFPESFEDLKSLFEQRMKDMEWEILYQEIEYEL